MDDLIVTRRAPKSSTANKKRPWIALASKAYPINLRLEHDLSCRASILFAGRRATVGLAKFERPNAESRPQSFIIC